MDEYCNSFKNKMAHGRSVETKGQTGYYEKIIRRREGGGRRVALLVSSLNNQINRQRLAEDEPYG